MTILDSDSYTATFGGQNRAPAQIDYVAYTTATDLHLQWPFLAEDGAFVAPAKLDINATVSGLKIFMPDAAIASVGQDCLVRNIGTYDFTVCDFDGNTIVNVALGLQWLVWIVDDGTPAGLWTSVQFSAGVSSTNAAALAGAGLRAEVTRLDQDLITTPLISAYMLGLGDRARVKQNNGGVVVWTTADAGVLTNGWFCYIVNSGSGTLTVDPFGSQTIDGAATKAYAPGENSILFCDGANFITLGYGRSLVNTVSGASITVAPGGTIVLTSPQIAAQVQNWTGTLTSNAILEYGGGVGYWFVWNNTSGAFSTTARTSALDPGVSIPQGNFSIIRSDGSNMNIAFTATSGTVTEVRTQAGETVGGPITSTGTIGLADTAVSPGTYGDARHTARVTVDNKGRLTAASSPLIAIPSSQINDFASFMLPGLIVQYAGWEAPASTVWLPCDGTWRAIVDFPALNAVIHGIYGIASGYDGTHFVLPDTRGRVLAGADAGTGRLRNAYFPGGDSNTPGNAGGYDAVQYNTYIAELFVRCGYWDSPPQSSTGLTTGAQSVNIVSGIENQGPVVVPGNPGWQVSSYPHNHNVNGWTGGESLSIIPSTFGTYGTTDGADRATDVRTNVQPTLIIRHLIKT